MSIAAHIDNLTSPDWRVRMEAADRLSGTEDPEAVRALVRALDDGDWGVRRSALHALGNGAPVALAGAIADKLGDPHPVVRETAASILLALGDEGVRQFFRILGDSSHYPPAVRREVFRWLDKEALAANLETLARIHEQETDPELRDDLRFELFLKRDADIFPVPELPPEVAPGGPVPDAAALLDHLRTGNASRRKTAARLLAVHPVEPVIAALIAALDDRIGIVCHAAAMSLEKIGQPALPQLEAAAPDPEQRARAVAELDPAERIRSMLARPIVEPGTDRDPGAWVYYPEGGLEMDLLSHPDTVRLDTARKLQKVKPGFLGTLVQEIQRETDPKKRVRLVQQLAALRDKRALEPLMVLAREADRNSRGSAMDGIIVLEDPRAADFLSAMVDKRESHWFGAARALHRMGDPRGTDGLAGYLRAALAFEIGRERPWETTENPSACLHGLAGMFPSEHETGTAADPPAHDPGKEPLWAIFLKGEDVATALRLLLEAGDGRVVVILEEAVRTGGAAYFATLLKLLDVHPDHPDVLHFVMKCARSGESAIRRLALEQLAARWQAAEPDLYLELLDDPDAALREYAAVGLYRIGNRTNVEGVLRNLPCFPFEEDTVHEYLRGEEALLLRLLADPDEALRGQAAEYLGRLNHQPAIPALIRLLEDPAVPVVESAVIALEWLGWWPF